MGKLVCVSVITYNAAAFVEETLDSTFNQTYENIQLIISDDCSRDNTVEVVEKWCNQPRVQQRFSNINIITVPKNTGVSANCNRSIAASKAEWIKFIAGDDILLPGCIEENVRFFETNPDAKILFSQVKVYQDNFRESNFVVDLPAAYPDNLMHQSFTASDQFKLLLISDRVNYTPSYFFNKETILLAGGYDEKNKLVEDYPMWLKLTGSGIKLHYFHKPTVGYRIHAAATNNTGNNVLFKPAVINSFEVRRKYVHPHLPFLMVRKEIWVYHVTRIFHQFGWNKNKLFYRILYFIATVLLNPFLYLNKIRQMVCKRND